VKSYLSRLGNPFMCFDVIIVNWNAGQKLYNCINSVMQYGQPFVNKIIVVDNGSTDGSEIAINSLPSVNLIRSDINLGFAKACNIAASHADSEFILFLNPDASLFPDSLTKLIDFMKKTENKKIGICGIQLIDEYGHISRSCARLPTASNFIAHAIGIDRLFPKLGYLMREWDHTTNKIVDHVIGAFYLVRCELFKQMGGFDERFFVYLEDLDFSVRARQIGWTTYYLADAQAFHSGGGVSWKVKDRRLYYSLKSRLLYGFKHFSNLNACLLTFITIILEIWIRLIRSLMQNSLIDAANTIKAYRMLLKSLPEIITISSKKILGD
jgi:GT2 family glycosyltransferase